jgi:hypothetical protein
MEQLERINYYKIQRNVGSATQMKADPSNLAIKGVVLQPLAYWDCRFKSHLGHGCLSLLSVVYCQVEVSVLCSLNNEEALAYQRLLCQESRGIAKMKNFFNGKVKLSRFTCMVTYWTYIQKV